MGQLFIYPHVHKACLPRSMISRVRTPFCNPFTVELVWHNLPCTTYHHIQALAFGFRIPNTYWKRKRRERAYARVRKEKQESAGEYDSAQRSGPLLDRYSQLEKRIRDLERKHTALLSTVRVSTLARQSYQSPSAT